MHKFQTSLVEQLIFRLMNARFVCLSVAFTLYLCVCVCVCLFVWVSIHVHHCQLYFITYFVLYALLWGCGKR